MRRHLHGIHSAVADSFFLSSSSHRSSSWIKSYHIRNPTEWYNAIIIGKSKQRTNKNDDDEEERNNRNMICIPFFRRLENKQLPFMHYDLCVFFLFSHPTSSMRYKTRRLWVTFISFPFVCIQHMALFSFTCCTNATNDSYHHKWFTQQPTSWPLNFTSFAFA